MQWGKLQAIVRDTLNVPHEQAGNMLGVLQNAKFELEQDNPVVHVQLIRTGSGFKVRYEADLETGS